MADTLKKVIQGEISVKDVIQWLGRDKQLGSQISERRGEFVPYYSRHLKECCLWIESSRTNEEECREVNDVGLSTEDDDVVALIRSLRTDTLPHSFRSNKSLKKGEKDKPGRPSLHCDNSAPNPRSPELKRPDATYIVSKSNSRENVPPNEISRKSHQISMEDSSSDFSTDSSRCSSSMASKRNKTKYVKVNETPIFNARRPNFKETKGRKPKGKQMPYEQRLSHIPEHVADFDLQDSDSFPSLGSQTVPKSRITPIPCKSIPQVASAFTNSVIHAPLLKKKDGDLKKERALLKMERKKRSQPVSDDKDSSSRAASKIETSARNSLTIHVSEQSSGPIEPDVLLVENFVKIQLYVELHSSLLNAGYLSYTAELCFLAKLLTMKVHSRDLNFDNPFSNVHNCFFFAASVLDREKYIILKIMDRSTLKLLRNVPHLKEFSYDLCQYLDIAIKSTRLVEVEPVESIIQGVPFKMETDTRCCFPSPDTFTSFSKQRSMFNALLQGWMNDDSHDEGYPSFLEFKAKELVAKGADNFNCFHLARLIKCQILISCIPVKCRDMTQSSLGPLTNRNFDAFHGIQRFFAILLKGASSLSLNQYFLHVVCADISAMSQFDDSIIENISLEDLQERFSSSLQDLCLLAKFYGYVSFMPYRSNIILPRTNVNYQREQCPYDPPIDIKSILEKAKRNHHLVYTVPWICEVINMMDQVSFHRSKNHSFLQILVEIHRGFFDHHMSTSNGAFVKLCISQLLDNPFFPWHLMHFSTCEVEDYDIPEQALDFYDVVNSQLFCSFPYLQHFKALLKSCTKHEGKNETEIREFVQNVSGSDDFDDSEKPKEVQFEQSFYCLQPTVMKKGVDIIIDQVCAKVVSGIRSELDEHCSETAEIIFMKQNFPKRRRITSLEIVNLASSESNTVCKEMKKFALDLTKNTTAHDVHHMLDAVFSTHCSQVRKTAGFLAIQKCFKRLGNWIEANLCHENITSLLKSKINKKLRSTRREPWFLRNINLVEGLYSPDISPAYCLASLQEIAAQLLCEKGDIPHNRVMDILVETKTAVEKQYAFDIVKQIVQNIFNVILGYMFRRSSTEFLEVVNISALLLCSCPKNSYCTKDIICPRNSYFFNYFKTQVDCWKRVCDLVQAFTAHGIFSHDFLKKVRQNKAILF